MEFSFLGLSETESIWYSDHYLAYFTIPGWCMMMGVEQPVKWWQGKLKCSEKTCSSAALSTTNPTWPDLSSNLGLSLNLSLVSTIDELFGRNSSGSCLESREYSRRDPSRWPRGTLCPQKKLALTLPTSCGSSACIVRSRIQATEFSLVRAWEACHCSMSLAAVKLHVALLRSACCSSGLCYAFLYLSYALSDFSCIFQVPLAWLPTFRIAVRKPLPF
jgi:hypothetical protein